MKVTRPSDPKPKTTRIKDIPRGICFTCADGTGLYIKTDGGLYAHVDLETGVYFTQDGEGIIVDAEAVLK